MTYDETEETVRRLIEDNLDEETRKAALIWFNATCRRARGRGPWPLGREPKTISDLIDALGGANEVAKILDLSSNTAGAMRREGIRVAYWRKIIAAAAERGIRGVSYDTLIRMHEESAPTNRDRLRGKAAYKAHADHWRPIFAEFAGLPAHEIAAKLTARGIATPKNKKGGEWNAATVRRVQSYYHLADAGR